MVVKILVAYVLGIITAFIAVVQIGAHHERKIVLTKEDVQCLIDAMEKRDNEDETDRR